MSKQLTLSALQVEDARRLIQHKVKRFLGRGIPRQEFEDACSTTMLEILAKLSSYDPERSSLPTYLDRISENTIRDQVRHNRAAKRGKGRPVGSLNERVCGDDSKTTEVWQTVDNRTSSPRRRSKKLQLDDHDLSMDLAEKVKTLSEAEKSLLQAKLSGESPSEMAVKFGVNIGTIYRRLRALQKKLRTLKTYV